MSKDETGIRELTLLNMVRPSTSLMGGMSLIIVCSSMCLGRGCSKENVMSRSGHLNFVEKATTEEKPKQHEGLLTSCTRMPSTLVSIAIEATISRTFSWVMVAGQSS